MSRRKPVPPLSPTTVPPLMTRGAERPSLSITTKEDLPPLPMEVCEKMERTSVDDRRHAIYLPESLPPSPPPKDGSAAGSRPESLVATLVDGMEVREDIACRRCSLVPVRVHLANACSSPYRLLSGPSPSASIPAHCRNRPRRSIDPPHRQSLPNTRNCAQAVIPGRAPLRAKLSLSAWEPRP
uniref:Calcium dependent mitochondrial carrier protein n=1 Tax=Ganoderma boninense TaxID=34458 RepID=A0A5K1JTR0_9APHY|nr:Calcium dependent mitochondrial carrier protein [Ganoderma boninense]